MTQEEKIFTHLKRYGRITPITALDRYGCFRLAARIHDLRAKGYRIETEQDRPYAIYRYYSKGAA